MMIRKILIITLIIAFVFILCPIGITYFSTNPYTKVINMNWKIELPNKDANVVYSYSLPSPHGDGIRYHVIDYPNENNPILDDVFCKSEKPTEKQITHVRDLLSNEKIEKDVFSEFDNCELVYLKQDDYSELFLFYNRDTKTVYVVESFI